MPLGKNGAKIKRELQKEYGTKKGEQVFYAMVNKGKIKSGHKRKKRSG